MLNVGDGEMVLSGVVAVGAAGWVEIGGTTSVGAMSWEKLVGGS